MVSEHRHGISARAWCPYTSTVSVHGHGVHTRARYQCTGMVSEHEHSIRASHLDEITNICMAAIFHLDEGSDLLLRHFINLVHTW